MKNRLARTVVMVFVAIVAGVLLCSSSARGQGWPEVFQPNQLLTLNLDMDPSDWDTIRYDLTFDIEVEAQFWADGETPITVAVRRKSALALPDKIDPFKIAVKIDINEIVSGQEWHGLRKLSLENGDDFDVLSEGIACNIHRMASGPKGYNYIDPSFYANWVVLNINAVNRGVYVNNEQHDKRFLQNRGLFIQNQTWLYKRPGDNTFELRVGDVDNPKSPAVEALCYDPFVFAADPDLIPEGGVCPVPDDPNLVAMTNEWVNIKAMLAMEATNAFVANPDSLFSNTKNIFFLDFNLPSDPRKRMYFPWDQDSPMISLDFDIYQLAGPTIWRDIILSNPTFRSQYNQILKDLLNGPLSSANISAFIDDISTPELIAALTADPHNQIGGAVEVLERFVDIKNWYADRIVNVLAQVDFDEPGLQPAIVLLQDGFEGVVWDDHWNDIAHAWEKDTTTIVHGSASAHADKNNFGDFTSDPLDTSDAHTIHIDLWFMKNKTNAGDFQLYYYDGTSYDLIADLGTVGSDDVWLPYTDTVTDSQYFIPNFQIRFNAALAGGGPPRKVWVDDVVITKETPGADSDGDGFADSIDNCPDKANPLQTDSDEDGIGDECECDAANLNGINPVDLRDYLLIANDWMLTGPALAGDTNRDDMVNEDDLHQLAEHWLRDCSLP